MEFFVEVVRRRIRSIEGCGLAERNIIVLASSKIEKVSTNAQARAIGDQLMRF